MSWLLYLSHSEKYTSLVAWCLICAGGGKVSSQTQVCRSVVLRQLRRGGERRAGIPAFLFCTRVESIMLSFNIIVGSHALSEHGPSGWRPNIAGDPYGLYVLQLIQQLSWHSVHSPPASLVMLSKSGCIWHYRQ